MRRRIHLVATLLLATFLMRLPLADVKTYQRCELTKVLLTKYKEKFNKTFISNWICMIEHESNRSTTKETTKPNGSTSYGLFQINSKEWCVVGRKGGKCNKDCRDFLDDDISDDIECAFTIYSHEGFRHWSQWNRFCRDQNNVPNLIVFCNINAL